MGGGGGGGLSEFLATKNLLRIILKMVCEAYCFYSIIDENGRVVAFYVACKTMVNNSGQMGKHFYRIYRIFIEYYS
jgi:hypothetical protein